MKAGKSTETIGNRLDALTPGPAFDNAAAWNKLQQRLENKKTRILFPWKWAAAAALLICCTAVLWPSAKKETSLVKTNDGNKNPAPGIQLTGKEDKSIVKQKEMAVPHSPAKPNNTADFSSIQVKTTAVIPVNEEIAISDSFTQINPISQPGPTLSVEPAAVKKNLRVVYNNDLAVTDPEEVVAPAEESENPIPLFRKTKLNQTLKAENIQPEDITPRRKKGILFFGPSIKPKD